VHFGAFIGVQKPTVFKAQPGVFLVSLGLLCFWTSIAGCRQINIEPEYDYQKTFIVSCFKEQ